MQLQLATQAKPSPHQLYLLARQQTDPARRRILLMAAAEERHPAACWEVKGSNSLWEAIAQSLVCTWTIPPELAEFAGRGEFSNTGCSLELLRGLAYESGVLPSSSPTIVARDKYFATLPHIISCERLSLLCGNGLAPFNFSRLSREDESILYLTAAAVARVVLSPLLVPRTANVWTAMSPIDLFDGLFAAFAAISRRHARTALLLGKLLCVRFGKAHEDDAKRYFEIAARECNFEACVEMASNEKEGTRWRNDMLACAIGAAEEAEAERTLRGEKRATLQGPWKLELPANAAAVLLAVKPLLASIDPNTRLTLSTQPPLVTFTAGPLRTKLLDCRAALAEQLLQSTRTASETDEDYLSIGFDATSAPSTSTLSMYANNQASSSPAQLYANVAPPTASPALPVMLVPSPATFVQLVSPSDSTGEVGPAIGSARHVWNTVVFPYAFRSDVVDDTPRVGIESLRRTGSTCSSDMCESTLTKVDMPGVKPLCLACFPRSFPDFEVRVGAAATAIIRPPISQRAANILLSSYCTLSSVWEALLTIAANLRPQTDGFQHWPFWVNFAQFELVYAQQPPPGMTHSTWLLHLIGTRFFYGRISTEAATKLVGDRRGTFILRFSSVPGALTVTVGLGEGRARHYRIGRNSDHLFVPEDSENSKFESLEDALRARVSMWGLKSVVGRSPYSRFRDTAETGLLRELYE